VDVEDLEAEAVKDLAAQVALEDLAVQAEIHTHHMQDTLAQPLSHRKGNKKAASSERLR